MFITKTLSQVCNLNSNLDMTDLEVEIHLSIPIPGFKTTELIKAL